MTCFDYDLGDFEDGKPTDHDAKLQWYKQGDRYWASQPPTVEGMVVGPGAGSLSNAALQNAEEEELKGTHDLLVENHVTGRKALDVGCGIGRVSRGVLHSLFAVVDMADPSPDYISVVERSGGAPGGGKLECHSLQSVGLDDGPYKLVLVNWCCAYVTDDDLICFLKRAGKCLTPNGRIMVKENTAQHSFRARRASASVTRTDAHYKDVFALAHLDIDAEKLQPNMPESWLDIRMYLLKPKPEAHPENETKD